MLPELYSHNINKLTNFITLIIITNTYVVPFYDEKIEVLNFKFIKL